MQNDILKELGTNFIEYAVAVNTDRAIPDATSGLKPVAKRILYGAYHEGYSSSKSHVKCANIVGEVMAKWHPHGDSSIYGALVRLAQPWVMRYPLIDFHGSMGNRDGDGPAAYRYTEARLAKISEDGLLEGIKKKNVDFIPNYSETEDEPITLPSIFPNLLCNPNSGIGVAMACNWLPHNLNEVAQAITDCMDGKEPTLPGPDFPTGGLIINQKDIPSIMKTGHGSVKVRGKYKMEGNNIVFYEIPYGIATEPLMEQIGKVCEEGKLDGLDNIRNESNRKQGFRLVLECGKTANIKKIIDTLFKETDLQTSISYNQVALVDKTPVELNLKQCIEIYIKHNTECIIREVTYDKNKALEKLEIIEGLLIALAHIDDIIAIIKKSESSAAARVKLIEIYKFSEAQAKAIVDMRLGKLAGLEQIEVQNDKKELLAAIEEYNTILAEPVVELRGRLAAIVAKYGDSRRTELANIEETKAEKEIVNVEPEKCVVVMTENGTIKRIPIASFKTQRRAGKGIKTQEDITSAVIRTNTIDSLMIFTNFGKMYRLIVDAIPVGTNVSKGTPIAALIEMEPGEKAEVIYSIYRDTDAKYVLFATKQGMVKKTPLDEYINTKKKNGIIAINIKEDDALAAVTLVKDEPLIILTKNGHGIKFNSSEVSPTGRSTVGVKGINLGEEDEVVTMLPIRNSEDNLAIFTNSGFGKKLELKELVSQRRGGKGLQVIKFGDDHTTIAAAQLIGNEDNVLILGQKSSICVSASEIPVLSRQSTGNIMLKDVIKSVSKV